MIRVAHNLEVSRTSTEQKGIIPKLSLLTQIASSGTEKYLTAKQKRNTC